MLTTIYRNEAVSCMHVIERFQGCIQGQEELEDDPRSGQLLTAQNPSTVAKFLN